MSQELRYDEDNELRMVLARAEEIQRQEAEPELSESRLEEYLAAAEEAGLSRKAMLQAMRERANLTNTRLEVGEHVFARSSDDKYYVAEVLRIDEGFVKVRFLSGTDHNVLMADVRPLAILPGMKLNCPWPSWGWWNCTVTGFDHKKDRVEVTDGWGGNAKFHLSEIRLLPEKPKAGVAGAASKMYYLLAALGGGVVGAVLTMIFAR